MKRWLCPNGCGGKLAPERPRKNDVRRYCLRCSEKTGYLVERTCTSLERKRDAAKEQQKKKAAGKRRALSRQRATKKERARERRFIMGHDVQALCKRWYKLKSWAPYRSMPSRPPKLAIRLSSTKSYLTAHAQVGGRHRITMTVPSDWVEPTPQRVAQVLMTIVHELAHLFVPPDAWHDERFNRCLCTAVHAIWGSAVSGDVISGEPGYRLSRLFEKKLEEHLKSKETEDAKG